jgi:hypothetical protein
MKRVVVALSALLFITVSCIKDDNNISKENLVGSYTLVSVTAKYGTSPEVDITDDWIEPCQQDDVTTLKADDTYAVVDAGVQCDPPSDDVGTWSVSGNSFTLDGETFVISSFSGNTLVLSVTETSGGQTATLKMTLRKQ